MYYVGFETWRMQCYPSVRSKLGLSLRLGVHSPTLPLRYSRDSCLVCSDVILKDEMHRFALYSAVFSVDSSNSLSVFFLLLFLVCLLYWVLCVCLWVCVSMCFCINRHWQVYYGWPYSFDEPAAFLAARMLSISALWLYFIIFVDLDDSK